VVGSVQPYHAGLELPPSQAEPTVRRLCESVRRVSAVAARELVGERALLPPASRRGRRPRGPVEQVRGTFQQDVLYAAEDVVRMVRIREMLTR
jgi:hypothetical protein